MGLVKNFKDKLSEHFVSNDYDEYDDSAITEDDFEPKGSSSSIYDEPTQESAYTFTPQPGINVPEYNYESKTTHRASQKVMNDPAAPVRSSAGGANIYDMNKARPTNKFKLNSILLRDIYDAKNVATLMMEKDTIVVVNLSQLSDEQKVRAMDFLDGAKYVTKSLFARFAENICAFVPESVELYGDFFSQIDLDSFNK